MTEVRVKQEECPPDQFDDADDDLFGDNRSEATDASSPAPNTDETNNDEPVAPSSPLPLVSIKQEPDEPDCKLFETSDKEDDTTEEGQIMETPTAAGTPNDESINPVSTLSIPRKASIRGDGKSPDKEKAATCGTDKETAATCGTVYGLPPEVRVPSSVDPKLLDGRLLESLKTLPSNLINEALVEYDDAVHNKEGKIRNHGAYLYGVIKRYKSVQERASHDVTALPMGDELTPKVQVCHVNRVLYLLSMGTLPTPNNCASKSSISLALLGSFGEVGTRQILYTRRNE
jgi:hypothetical protein